MEKENVDFLFLMRAPVDNALHDYDFTVRNTGIPYSDVILWVRAWLEKAEEALKSDIQNKF